MATFFRGCLPLQRITVWREALAGAILASMDIPQLLGYARIAGMPPETGFYSGIMPVLAFAVLGSSRHLVVAADSATATIFSSKLSKMAAPLSPEYIALAGMTALLTGFMLLVARWFRLGFLADFLSRTVLIGFLAGVGIQVGTAMLGDMLGLSVTSTLTVVQLYDVVIHLLNINEKTSLLSLLIVMTILLGKYYRPRWPLALVAVVFSTTASAYWNFAGQGIRVIGPVHISLPHPTLFTLSWIQMLELLQVAGACFVVIISQSMATTRAFAERYEDHVDADADFLGLAAANISAALSGAFVVNGSPTQTAMAEQAGGRSQLTQLVFCAVVILVFLLLGNWLSYLPQCVLASVVFTIAVGLVSWKKLVDIRRESPGEFTLALMTALSVLVAGVENGILIAIALSLLRHVRHSYQPHTMVLVPDDEGHWKPTPLRPGIETAEGLIIYRFGADLFYANEQRFINEVRLLSSTAPNRVGRFVIDASAITDLDYSAGHAVGDLFKELTDSGIGVVMARVSPYLRADLDRHGVTAVIGAGNIHDTLHEALEGHQDLTQVPVPG